jgi:ribulose-phosphate 3-epimerase
MPSSLSPLIAPSVLAADFAQLGEAIRMIETSEADWIHCDVMDGHFVPNISFGLPVIEAMAPHARKPLDVHLMIEQPDRYLADFAQAGAHHLTIHAEVSPHLDRSLRAIRQLGLQAGVALNPATPLTVLDYVLPLCDIVLLMTVNPGFGGQSFIPYVLDKVRTLRQRIDQMEQRPLIEVDGGVDLATAPALIEAGADVLVAGSHVFKAADPQAAISGLKAL